MKVRRGRGRITVTLNQVERDVVRTLAGQVARMLEPDGSAEPADPLEAMVGMSTGEVAAPEDDAVRRLLPDAYAEDAEAAAEFRRLMDSELRREKTAALTALIDALGGAQQGPLTLTEEQAAGWVQAINDVRLVLGVRLDVREDSHDEWARLTAADPRLPLVLAYDLTTYLQQELIEALSN